MQTLSVIVVSYNTADITLRCVMEVLNEFEGLSSEVIVVDNNSQDNTVELLGGLERLGKISIIEESKNLGYAGAVNSGVKKASGRYLLIMNSDVFIKKSRFKGNFSTIVEFFEQDAVGVIGFQQTFQDGSWQRSFGKFPSIFNTLLETFFIPNVINKLKNMFHGRIPSYTRKVEYIDGALLLTTKSVFEKIGGFDESYFFYVEEVDFCYSLKKIGLKAIFYPFISIVHLRGESSKSKKMVSEFSVINSVNSQFIFISKKHGKIYTSTFTKLNVLKYTFYSLIYKINNQIKPSNNKEYKMRLFALYKEKWKQTCAK